VYKREEASMGASADLFVTKALQQEEIIQVN